MDIVERLRITKTMSQFESLSELYAVLNTDRLEAADEIEWLREDLVTSRNDVASLLGQLATVTKERDELVAVVSKAVKLNSFREFNDHIPAMKAALAKLGADKTGE